jgi:GST-like protein
MPKIQPQNATVRKLTGLHLYHAGWSNCSMRVRMTLEEKSLAWTSHHLNTRAGEHITPEYFGINPKGLVPALVHDGDVWTESADIIRYLDDTYPEPRLVPSDKRQRAELSDWMRLASDIHVTAIKTYIYSSRPKNASGKSPDELARYRKLQTDEQLLAFHAKCASSEGISAAERAGAEQLIHDAFSKLDARLAKSPWLVGERFTLADITWIPLHYTLERAGFSLHDYPNVGRWAQAIAVRPSYRKAVLDWFDGPREAETVTITRPGG